MPRIDKEHEHASIDEENTGSSLNDWYDKCVYRCNACPRSFKSTTAATNHVMFKRHLSYTSISTPKHACKICKASFFWHKHSIKKHLKRTHGNLSLEKYGRRCEGVCLPRSDLAKAEKEDQGLNSRN
jgi:hypothetical protein